MLHAALMWTHISWLAGGAPAAAAANGRLNADEASQKFSLAFQPAQVEVGGAFPPAIAPI